MCAWSGPSNEVIGLKKKKTVVWEVIQGGAEQGRAEDSLENRSAMLRKGDVSCSSGERAAPLISVSWHCE